MGASVASAGLVVHYTFDGDDATNSGTGADGTALGGGTYVDSTAGFNAGRAWQGNRGGANDALINTGLTGNDLGFGAGGVYTAMAWVNWAGTLGGSDHMVFGAPGAGNFTQLHHGVRDDSAPNNIHFGGWGGAQDVSDAGAIPNGGGLTGADNWVHVAWQYDGTDKVVFVDGVETFRGPGNNISDPSLDVAIGYTARNGNGSFNGLLDDVRIYDEALTAGQILTARNTVIPEPSSLGLLTLTGLAFLRRRR